MSTDMKTMSDGSYFVKVRGSRWYVYHQSVKDGVRRQVVVPKALYPHLGFDSEWSWEEARARAKRLNQEGSLLRSGSIKSGGRALDIIQEESIFFPRDQVAEFVRRLDEDLSPTQKHRSHFAFVQRMILELKILPQDYADRAGRFYKYLTEKQCSPDYAKRLIRMLNRWGLFVSRPSGRYFEPLKSPRGSNLYKLEDEHQLKEGVRRPSRPLTPEMLERAKSKLDLAEYNWLLFSVWFGLRPSEVDGLDNANTYRLDDGVIAIYQGKLTGVAFERRWKFIPLLEPQQRKLAETIDALPRKRPYTYKLRKVFGKDLTLYAGRKGYERLMIDKGHRFEDVADWLGHKNLNTTFKHYRERGASRTKSLLNKRG